MLGTFIPKVFVRNLVTTPFLPRSRIHEYAPMNGGDNTDKIINTSIRDLNLILVVVII